MILVFHLASHISASLIIGFVIWKKTHKKTYAFLGALLGGVFIDLDHFIDYYLTFGLRFNLHYFLNGYEFLKSDRVYIIFHAYEYVILLIVISFFIKRKITKAFIIALAIGIFSHLIIDVYVNNMKPQSYFILYRLRNNFELHRLIRPENLPHYYWQRRKIIL